MVENKPIQLTPEQLDEDMPPKIQEMVDPQGLKMKINYSYWLSKYDRKINYDNTTIHFEYDGDTILKDSDEAKIQEEIRESRQIYVRECVNKFELGDLGGEFNIGGNMDFKLVRKIMRNKFNYSQRSAQTPLSYLKDQGLSTLRPQLQVNLFEIFEYILKKIYFG